MFRKVSFFLLALLIHSYTSLAQGPDTVWVNTLNFNDITKRRGTWQFPAAGEKWQEIKMHYTLKCDPRTTQDQFPCGEWDYLSYTIVHDSTGRIDSNEYQHSNFLIGDQAPDSFHWLSSRVFDTLDYWQYHTIVDQVASRDSATTGTGTKQDSSLFTSPRTQYLFTAAELGKAGVKPGNITALAINADVVSPMLRDATVYISATTQNALTSFQPFSQPVFAGDVSPNNGSLYLELLQPFAWDGTSNLVLQFHNGNTRGDVIRYAADTSTSGMTSSSGDLYYAPKGYAFLEVENAASALKNLDSVISISFWCKGDETLPQNTSILEARDAEGNRVINIHMPWSNGQIYWDAGNSGGSYDRINKVASTTEMKGQWNHWVFVKNASTGSMKIYKNGQLWHSGTAKKFSMKQIVGFRIGKGTGNHQYAGSLDHLSVWNTELSSSDILTLQWQDAGSSHPKRDNLLFSFSFDNFDMGTPSFIQSVFPTNVLANVHGEIPFKAYAPSDIYFGTKAIAHRPQLKWYQADQTTHLDSTLNSRLRPQPMYSVELFNDLNSPTKRTSFTHGTAAGYQYRYLPGGEVKDSFKTIATNSVYKALRSYFVPFEIVDNIEIGRYITPYGIGFDLGPNGFRWEYDVTDYAYLLNDLVTLSAGNQQELIDLRFEFIKGEAPRDVKKISYYANLESRSYNSIAINNTFKENTLQLHPDAKTFKLITRITGHGHNTDPDKNHCCEWADKKHYMKINGQNALEWDIWQDDKCALNPLIDQGGNWAPPRAGWCPGAPVDDYVFDITKYISGNQVKLDYEIEPVPVDNPGQGGGNYVVSFHLVEYGDWKRQNDAAISRIIRPTTWEFYNRLNPTCAQPRIEIKNTGSLPMTSATIRYGIENGNPIEFGWKGNLAPDASEAMDLPFAMWDYLSSTNSLNFFAEVIRVNGVTDEYAGNSKKTSKFSIPKVAPTTLDIWFRNNSIPDATVTIKNDQGKVVYEKLDGAAGALNKQTLNLDPGCYKLECVTENGFGLSYPLIPQVGSGLLRLSGSNGFLQSFNPDFGKAIEYYFTVAYALDNKEMATPTWQVYPNPSNGIFTIDISGTDRSAFDLRVFDLAGKVVLSSTGTVNNGFMEADISNQPDGVYVLQILHNGKAHTFKLVKHSH